MSPEPFKPTNSCNYTTASRFFLFNNFHKKGGNEDESNQFVIDERWYS